MTCEHTLQPAARNWIAAVWADGPAPTGSVRVALRDALRLDAAAPSGATGHRAAIWHPGSLAKDLSLAATAAADPGLQTLHFIADHYADDGGLLTLPSGTGPTLHPLDWNLLPATNGR
ncbi:MAG: hypothetical protein GY825_04040, partial [Phycisphaeraceae bacterium]|nr:hypothetical protein [Phycisphaeraceae bacterium]